MSFTYRIVAHDGGYAYAAGDTISETFDTRASALSAARRAALEQRLPGRAVTISYETADGIWHNEMSSADDRPDTGVED